MSCPLSALLPVTAHLNLLLIKTLSIRFAVLSVEYHASLQISLHENVALLTLKPLELQIESFLFCCWFHYVNFQCQWWVFMSSLSTSALKSPSIISMSELAT
jgi:hypothetical protein